MKKSIPIICMLLFSCNLLFAQEELNKKVQTVEKKSSDRYEELKTEITKLKSQYKLLESEVSKTKGVLKDVSGINLKTRTRQKKQTVQTAVFVKTANKSFGAIDASIAQSSYMRDVIKLNNPTNDDLGFSLKSVIDELLKTHILSKDKNLGKSGKVNNFVTSLIEHPITEIVKSAVPAINTVVSFVSNLSFGSKKIKEEDFQNFTQGLKKYVEHYEGLANATSEYEANLQQIQLRTSALEIYLKGYAIERMSSLYQKESFKNDIKVLNLNELQRKYYSDDIIEKLYESEENDELYNYPITALNQARYIQDELSSLSNQYIRVNFTYYESIKKTLEKSKELNEDYIPKIDKKLETLETALLKWVEKYEILVDIDDVKKEFNDLIN